MIRLGSTGSEEVDSRVYGAFAVHAPDGTPLKYIKPESRHTVTHVKTGYKVCVVEGRAKAISLARKLNRFLPADDFTTEDFETEKYKLFVQRAKPMVDEAKA